MPSELHRRLGLGLAQVNNDDESSSPELVIFPQVTGYQQVAGNAYTLTLTARENGTDRTATASRQIVIQYTPTP